MTADSDSMRAASSGVAIGTAQAGRDLFVAEVIHVYQIMQAVPPPQWEPHRNVPRAEVARGASALGFLLKKEETCIYLGRRYGLTPQSPVSPELLGSVALGVQPPIADSLSEAMGWLAGQVGMAAARRYLAEQYGSLDKVGSEIVSELTDLASVSPGRTFVTGSYSARIQNALGPALTIVQGDGQLGRSPSHRSSNRAQLLMLHGSEQDFQNALVAKDDVLTYREHRPALAEAVSDLLLSPWIVLGAEKEADSTFHLLTSNVSRKLGEQQRPLFVIDPRPEEVVENEWPRAALRHVRLTPGEFLSMARRAG